MWTFVVRSFLFEILEDLWGPKWSSPISSPASMSKFTLLDIFQKCQKHIFELCSYIQKTKPNPIITVKITFHNTKHTKHTKTHSTTSNFLKQIEQVIFSKLLFIIYQISIVNILYILYIWYPSEGCFSDVRGPVRTNTPTTSPKHSWYENGSHFWEHCRFLRAKFLDLWGPKMSNHIFKVCSHIQKKTKRPHVTSQH